jgi:hypothetical protein
MSLPARRTCRECNSSFLAIRHDRVFCRQRCRRAWHSRREAFGARAVELMLAWRGERKKGALSDLTALADELVRLERDRKAATGEAKPVSAPGVAGAATLAPQEASYALRPDAPG